MKRKNGPSGNKKKIKKAVNARRAAVEQKKIESNGNLEIDHNFVIDCLNANEIGDGSLYAALLHEKYLFNKTSKEWLKWSGHFWQVDELEENIIDVEAVVDRYLDAAREIQNKIEWSLKKDDKAQVKRLQKQQEKIYGRVQRLRSVDGRNKTVKVAHSNKTKSISINTKGLDSNPWLLAVENGVIDLKLGELREGRQDDYITKFCPVEFVDIDEPAPNWERFLMDIFENDEVLIAYIQRLFGYALTGLSIEHVIPILYGEHGRNGKGTLVETILKVVGDYAAPIQSEMLLDQGRGKSSAGPSPDIMHLFGLRMVFASETEAHRRFSTSKVKWLTGGDTMLGRYPHEKRFTRFIPTHTLFLLTNHIPHAPADDSAFWERVHIIPFNVSYVAREVKFDWERPADKYLPEKLLTEKSAILSWAIRGCLQWQAIGLDPPKVVTDATKDRRRKEDQFADFFDDCLIVDPEAITEASTIYDTFTEWWQRNVNADPKKTPSQNKIGAWLGRRFKKEKVGTIKYFGVGIVGEQSPDLCHYE